MNTLRILLFAANPLGDLQLDEEVRSIEDGIQDSTHRDSVTLIPALAARTADLISRISRQQPHVVHFSGHGLGGKGTAVSDHSAAENSGRTRELEAAGDEAEAQIVLEDPTTGAARPVGQKALTNLFRIRRGGIRLVFLNACFTRSLADGISEVVDCVIGTNRAIGDEAARVFSNRFYRTVADGGSIQQAFDDARVELELQGIPESATPVLLCRRGVNPAEVLLLDPNAAPEAPSRLQGMLGGTRLGVVWAQSSPRYRVFMLSATASVLLLLLVAGIWMRIRPAAPTPVPDAIARNNDRSPAAAGSTLGAEAKSRLTSRLDEAQKQIHRVFSFGPYSYLSSQLEELQQKVQVGTESEESLSRSVGALLARTSMMISLQDAEREAVGLSDQAESRRLLHLVRQARVDLFDDSVEAAGRIRSQISEKLAHRPPSAKAGDEKPSQQDWPRVLESGQDPHAAIPWLWQTGMEIRLGFMNGTPQRRAMVLEAAREWTKYANLTFKVVDDLREAHVRIALQRPLATPGSFYSHVGTDALQVPAEQPTLVLGFGSRANDASVRSITLWQFGHVLGLINEHDNPNCRNVLRYKPEKDLLETAARNYGWTPHATRQLLLGGSIEARIKAYRPCDPDSIMMRKLHPEFVEPTPPEISELSDGDKAFVRLLYPAKDDRSKAAGPRRRRRP
jgi:hypothetical protein